MSNPKDDFGAMLAEFEKEQGGPKKTDARPGDVVKGRVVSIGREKVFVDLGGRAEASLDREDVTDDDGNLKVAEGDMVEARVVAVEPGGALVLKRSIGRGPDAAAELEDAYAAGIPVEGTVMASIKGGFEVQIAGLRAFCPISQIDNKFVEAPDPYVGQKLTFRITKLEGGKRPNLVVSRRALLEEEAAATAEETRARLEPGAVFTGKVTSLKPYGAFVDLGGLEGMIHISELGYGRVDHPSAVLKEGQTVKVQVLKIEKTGDAKRPEKIALSMRALEADPWDAAVASYKEGATVEGQVTRVESYGAFVEIAAGVEGLVHVSEIPSDTRLADARKALSVGDRVAAQVVSIDTDKRRIGLSLKAVKAQEEQRLNQEALGHAKGPKSLGTLGDLLKSKLDKK